MRSLRSYHLLLLVFMVLVASCAPKGFSVEGSVSEIERGKDGYTAIVQSGETVKYHAVISRVNMQENYRELKVGEKAKLFGDTTHVGSDVYVKVRRIE